MRGCRVIAVLFFLLNIGSVFGVEIFSDDFDAMPIDQRPVAPWVCHDGAIGVSYSIESGGVLWVQSRISNPVVEYPTDWREGLLSVEIKPTNNGGNWLAVVGGGGYKVTLSQNPFRSITLSSIFTDMAEIKLENIPAALREAEVYRLQLACWGGEIKVLINGDVLLQCGAEVEQGSGLKLMGSWQSSILFSNIKFESLDEESWEGLGECNLTEVEEQLSDVAVVGADDEGAEVWDWGLELVGGPEDYVYHPGDIVRANLEIREPVTGELTIEYRLVDVYEDVVWRDSHLVEVGDLPVRDAVEFCLAERGIYRLEARLDGQDVQAAEMVLGAIASVDEKKTPYFDSPYGMSPILDDYHLGLCRAGGISWLRLHDMDLATYWAHVEPEDDVWRWRDEVIDLASDAGYYIMASFEATPLWASDAPESVKEDARGFRSDPSIWRSAWGYPTNSMEDLADYVYETVSHYRGRIQAWEVWNEPHVDLFWKGSVDEYVELSRVCYEAAKRADPDCIIVGGGGLNIYALPWIEAVLERGLLDYLDVFSIHGYADDAVTQANAENMGESIDRIREMMREYGGVEKSIWITEAGFHCESFFSNPELHSLSFSMDDIVDDAGSVVRGYVTCISEDVEKFFWWRLRHWGYSYHARHSHESLIEYTRAPKATFFSLAGLTERLAGAEFVESLDLAPYVSCKVFEDDARVTAVIWVAFDLNENGMLSVGSSGDLSLYDFMANPLDVEMVDGQQRFPLAHEPYYIILEGGTAEQLAGLLRDATVEDLYITEDNVASLREEAERRLFLESMKEPFAYARLVDDSDWFQVNLRDYVNMGFRDEVPSDGQGGWVDSGPFNDMRDMPTGDQLFCGVPFDVIDPASNDDKAVITLYSDHLTSMPRAVEGIDVSQRAGRLYFLHSAAWAGSRRDLMVYRIHYENGEVVELSIESTVTNGDWWLQPEPGEISHVVAIPTFNSAVATFRVKYLRIFEWVNPHPEWVIDCFDVVSAGPCIPVVIAVTGVR